MTLEIEIPANKEKEVIGVLKALGIKIKTSKGKIPNQETIAAIEEARNGKVKKIADVNSYFDSL